MAAVPDHGGSLERAGALFPEAPLPFIDLSTGINPHAYPLFDLPATAFSRLPEPARIAELAATAAGAYGAEGADCIVPAPGTQILLPLVMGLVPPGRAAVLGPTYAEHARCAALAGHGVQMVGAVEDLFEADLAVVVNPNNPDGRVVARRDLLALAEHLRAKGGLLVIDEAFMDVGPHGESLCGDVGRGGIVVLRSFGKFFGLAGLRLGFALAALDIARRLAAALGPWAVSGPAIEIGIRALSDRQWQDAMRERLADDRARLDQLLQKAGFPASGGTSLYAFLRHPEAPALFARLGASGIFVRRFDDRANVLRLGLPGDESAWERLSLALGLPAGRPGLAETEEKAR